MGIFFFFNFCSLFCWLFAAKSHFFRAFEKTTLIRWTSLFFELADCKKNQFPQMHQEAVGGCLVDMVKFLININYQILELVKLVPVPCRRSSYLKNFVHFSPATCENEPWQSLQLDAASIFSTRQFLEVEDLSAKNSDSGSHYNLLKAVSQQIPPIFFFGCGKSAPIFSSKFFLVPIDKGGIKEQAVFSSLDSGQTISRDKPSRCHDLGRVWTSKLWCHFF